MGTMTLATERPLDAGGFGHQHLVLDGISWAFYERLLDEIGDRPIRVTYSHGSLEIMPPLPEHEIAKKAIAQLIELLTLELGIPRACFGSTTFRREDKGGGLEPDECYYFDNAPRVRGMKRFDPAVHPAPDLGIEIDITQRSIPRDPIYADLGVRELWRFDGEKLTVLHLLGGRYHPAHASMALPFLPMAEFEKFVHRMLGDEDETKVLREFQAWVRLLRPE